MKTSKQILTVLLLMLSCIYVYNEGKPKPKKTVVKEADIIVIPRVEKTPEKVVDAPKVVEAPKSIVKPDASKLPDNIYVVRERIVNASTNGVTSLGVGEKVTKTGENGDKFIVTNDKITLEVEFWKLTNDKIQGEALMRKFAEIPKALPVVPPAPIVEETFVPTVVPKALPFIDLRITAIDAQIEVLRNKVDSLKNKATSKINANGPVITRLESEIKKLEAQK